MSQLGLWWHGDVRRESQSSIVLVERERSCGLGSRLSSSRLIYG